MKSISLYQPRDTFIHQGFDPFTKLIYLLCSMIAAFFIPTLLGAALLFLMNVVLLVWAGELPRALKTIAGSLVLLLTIFIIQGLFNPANQTLVLQLGPVHFYKEGLLFALTISFRVVNIITASCILILTTSPSSVMEACVRRGLPSKMGYVTVSILQIIPAMLSSAARIREAQQSRGMSMSGNVWARAKAFLPLFGPVVLSSLMAIQEKAMALEVRAFSVKTKKTFYQEERVLPYMTYVRLIIIVLTLAIVIWGLVR
jgi:energy-coupling factor transport system permease protein